MTTKTTKIILVVIAISILVALIMSHFRSPQVSQANPIKIGAIISETGSAAPFGEMSHKGIELAAQEINAAGGINGRQVVISYTDDQTDSKSAATAFQKLTSIDKVDALIGSNFDFVSQPLFALAKAGDTVIISPSQPRIPGAFDTNVHGYVMLTDFSEIIGSFKTYLQTTKHTQLGILRFESTFGESIQKTLNEVEKSLGNTAIVTETYKQIGTTDFRTQILKLKQAKVDLLFIDMVAIDPVTFMNQSRQLGYAPKLISHVGIKDALIAKDIDTHMFDGVGVINWEISPASFTQKFQTAYGAMPDHAADKAYQAVYVLAEAISRATSKSDIPTVLNSTQFNTPNGEFSFDVNHAAAHTPVEIDVVKDGVLVPWTK